MYLFILSWCVTTMRFALLQVVDFAGRLRDSSGSPIIRAAHISSSSPPPKLLPHVVVATPAGLMNATDEFPMAYGRFWSRDGIVRRSVPKASVNHTLENNRVLLSGDFRYSGCSGEPCDTLERPSPGAA